MRTFKIVVALLLAALCIGITVLIYLQSPGAALANGLLLALVIVSFLVDNRSHIFGGGAKSGLPRDKSGVAVAQAAALTRFAEGEVRGTSNYAGN